MLPINATLTPSPDARTIQLLALDYEADGICRDRACRCVAHSAADTNLLDAYDLPWRTLTATELRLLAALLPPGSVVPHVTLLWRAWGPDYATDNSPELHLLRVNMARLRHKLREQQCRWTVETATGIGYRLTRGVWHTRADLGKRSPNGRIERPTTNGVHP